MKVYLTSAYPYDPRLNFGVTYLQESAAGDAFQLGSLLHQFHLLAQACTELHHQRSNVNSTSYIKQYCRFLEAFHFRNLLRFYKNQLKARILATG